METESDRVQESRLQDVTVMHAGKFMVQVLYTSPLGGIRSDSMLMLLAALF